MNHPQCSGVQINCPDLLLRFVFLICVCSATPSYSQQRKSVAWGNWRGPYGSGSAVASANPVTSWSETENIKWKTSVPGLGLSSPIVVGEIVFVTTAIPTGEQLPPRFSGRPGAHDNLPVTSAFDFVAIAYDRNSGEVLWRKKLVTKLPREGAHKSASLASASPVSDGEHFIAYFGSHGLYCLDKQGELLWQKDLGEMHSKHGHGEGSSPVLQDGILAINWDHEEQSFVVALNVNTGKELWRKSRDEVTSWSTPLIVEHAGKQQLIVCGTERVRAYDLANGKVIWECGGMSANIVATPVHAGGIVFVGSSYEKRVLMAISLSGASGDITGSSNVLWSRTRGTPYVPSPLLVDGGLYFLAHYQNILTRIDAVSGKEAPGPMRLGELGNIYASPVAAGGNLFVTDLSGTTMVIETGDQPKLVGVNRLDEPVSASLAIAGNEIFLRGHEHLYCIADSN